VSHSFVIGARLFRFLLGAAILSLVLAPICMEVAPVPRFSILNLGGLVTFTFVSPLRQIGFLLGTSLALGLTIFGGSLGLVTFLGIAL
jgi:hypothetical protein